MKRTLIQYGNGILRALLVVLLALAVAVTALAGEAVACVNYGLLLALVLLLFTPPRVQKSRPKRRRANRRRGSPLLGALLPLFALLAPALGLCQAQVLPSVLNTRGVALEVDASLFGASPSATGAVNTNATNRTLSNYRVTKITRPGTYSVAAGTDSPSQCILSMGSDRALIGVPGVILKATAARYMLVNSNLHTGGTNSNILIDGITFDMDAVSSAGVTLNNLPTGNWNSGTPTAAPVGWNGHLMVFSGVTNLTIRNCTFKNAAKFCLLIARCQNVLIENCSFDTGSDGIHFYPDGTTGYSQNIIVRNITFKGRDDAVSFTIGDFATYEILNATTGDFRDVLVDGVHHIAGNVNGGVKYAGKTGYYLQRAAIRHITGTTTTGKAVAFVDDSSGGAMLIGGGLKGVLISDVDMTLGTSSPMIWLSNSGSSDVTVENAQREDINGVLIRMYSTFMGSNVAFRGLKSLNSTTTNVITLDGNVRRLNISDSDCLVNGASGVLLNLSSTAVLDSLNLSNINFEGTSNGKMIAQSAPGSVAFTGAAATDFLTQADHGLKNGDIVQVAGGSLPTGLSAATNYYVVSRTEDTYKLSATLGGSAIDLTADGSGTAQYKGTLAINASNIVLTKATYGFDMSGIVDLSISGITIDTSSIVNCGNANSNIVARVRGSRLLVGASAPFVRSAGTLRIPYSDAGFNIGVLTHTQASGDTVFNIQSNATGQDSTPLAQNTWVMWNATSSFYQPVGPLTFYGSVASDRGSIAAGAVDSFTVTVTGATSAQRDYAVCHPGTALETGLVMTVQVTTANVATIRLYNPTGSPIDPASRTYYVKVQRQSSLALFICLVVLCLFSHLRGRRKALFAMKG